MQTKSLNDPNRMQTELSVMVNLTSFKHASNGYQMQGKQNHQRLNGMQMELSVIADFTTFKDTSICYQMEFKQNHPMDANGIVIDG